MKWIQKLECGVGYKEGKGGPFRKINENGSNDQARSIESGVEWGRGEDKNDIIVSRKKQTKINFHFQKCKK